MKENYFKYRLTGVPRRSAMKHGPRGKEQEMYGFHCTHCHVFVCAEPALSGVKNRNHCPYCLWSKHVDLYKAGDRLSACKGRMRPIGLTRKLTSKRYPGKSHGELMVIHHCEECDSFSINRIAADDIPQHLLDTYVQSCQMGPNILARLKEEGIQPLNKRDKDSLHVQLFGHAGQVSAPLSLETA